MAAQSLPPIKTLFSSSWETLKGSALHLLIIYLISIGLFFVLFIAGLIFAIPLGGFAIINAIQNNGVSPAFFSTLGILGILVFILIIIGIVMATMIQAAMVLVVANYKSKPSYGAVLKQGLSLAWPLILASILMGFIVIGGYFLFIIPGIVLGLSLMFMTFEIILNKQGVIAGAKRSMGIVFSNFWGILARMVIFVILAILVLMIPNILSGGVRNVGMTGVFGILSAILNVLVGWYGLTFAITLYRQASASYSGKGTKLLWPVIIAAVGWIIGIIFIGSIITLLTTLVTNQGIKNSNKYNNMQYNKNLQKMLQNQINNSSSSGKNSY